jgi:hypothetical protein
MAFTGNFMATSFKQQLLEAVHDFRLTGGDTFKLALYDNNASFTAATTAFTATDEVPDSGSYASGGGTLTRIDPTTSGTTAFVDFQDLSFTSATINARGALIYNSTPTHTYTNPVVAVLDFGSDKISTTGTFTIQFPTPDASNAILRIA